MRSLRRDQASRPEAAPETTAAPVAPQPPDHGCKGGPREPQPAVPVREGIHLARARIVFVRMIGWRGGAVLSSLDPGMTPVGTHLYGTWFFCAFN